MECSFQEKIIPFRGMKPVTGKDLSAKTKIYLFRNAVGTCYQEVPILKLFAGRQKRWRLVTVQSYTTSSMG